MTDTTIPPLTEADVKALGFTPFGFERDDRMGGVLAHRDGEAFYMQRAAAFWSVDPEYGNMRLELCEAPPNWRTFRDGCLPGLIGGTYTHVLLWRVSDLPPDRLERLFNHDTIAPELAGLKAQAESTVKNLSETKVTPGDWAGNAPTEPRRPLIVGDRVAWFDKGDVCEGKVTRCRAVLDSHGDLHQMCETRDSTPVLEWHWGHQLFLVLED